MICLLLFNVQLGLICLLLCSVQLGNGEHGTDVRVRNNRLHCQNCYSNDEGERLQSVYYILVAVADSN